MSTVEPLVWSTTAPINAGMYYVREPIGQGWKVHEVMLRPVFTGAPLHVYNFRTAPIPTSMWVKGHLGWQWSQRTGDLPC